MSIFHLKRYNLVRNAILTWMTIVILGAFLLQIPRINILEHTARNLYFHVPMWFTMLGATLVSAYFSFQYLRTQSLTYDIRAVELARLGLFFGLLGLITGIVWSRYTWFVGTTKWWSGDPKQTLAAVGVFMYLSYFLLRSSIEEPEKKARLAAVYNLFAAVLLPFLLYVVPRQMESLHPGAEGNPAFSDITHPIMRLVFYPAIIGFFGLCWILYRQRVRLRLINEALNPLPE